MNNLILDHAFTPPELEKLNHLLLELFSLDPPDEAKLLSLIKQRDKLVQDYICHCDTAVLKSFCRAELEVNGALVAYTKGLAKASLKELSALIRGRKAVKKYI